MEPKAVTKERAHFCSHCGSAVKPEAEGCPTCGRPLSGTFEARRCGACGGLAEVTATECPQCKKPLEEVGVGELQELVRRSVEELNEVMADRRGWLDRLEGRMERTQQRMDAIKESTRDLDLKERARLNVWLKDAEGQREDALRTAQVMVNTGEALATVRSKMQEAPVAQVPLPATLGGGAAAAPPTAPEEREKQLQSWWDAQRAAQRDLISLAKEGAAAQGASQEAERQELLNLVRELKRIIDELPSGVRKKLQKSGKLEEIEALLNPSPANQA